MTVFPSGGARAKVDTVLRALVQLDLLKNVATADVASDRAEVFELADGDASTPLQRAAETMEQGGPRVVPLVSIQVAWRILRGHPRLAEGLVFSPERLDFHAVVARLGSVMLNERHLLVSWSRLPSMLPVLRDALGDGLFVRPNSALKPFTGFSGSVEVVAAEHAALSQTDGVAPEELCVVAPAAPLQTTEWRFWVVDGVPVTWAPYSWGDESLDGSVPEEVLDFARRAAAMSEAVESAVVMDVGIADGVGPRVLELNPLSTSGLYRGVDLDKLLDALGPLFPV